MRSRIRPVYEAYEVVRPVALSLIAMATIACAMVCVGWRLPTIAMGVVLAGLAGSLVFQVRRAVAELGRQSHRARQSAAEAERHYVEVLRRIIAFVEARDPYLGGHSENVGDLAGRIARRMYLPEATCQRMVLAGQLHDIGLLAVPDAILNAKARFGVEEFRTVKKHSEASYEVLRPLDLLADVLPAVRFHHERLNGTGYPLALSGQEIPIEARILAVADAYDAMTHDRPHRPAMTPLAAVRELRRCCPAGYDGECVGALEEILNIPALEDALGARLAACCV